MFTSIFGVEVGTEPFLDFRLIVDGLATYFIIRYDIVVAEIHMHNILLAAKVYRKFLWGEQ